MVNSIKLIKNLIRNKHVLSSLLNSEGHTKEAQENRACSPDIYNSILKIHEMHT